MKAAILGFKGLSLTEDEVSFFKEEHPFGFILFARNIKDRDQVKALVEQLKSVTRPDVEIFIDQEGGRVQRLKPPCWRQYPSMGDYYKLWIESPKEGREALILGTKLIAHDLAELGITANCAPVLDLLCKEGHGIIGDRSFSPYGEEVAYLGRLVCMSYLESGIFPVIKHIPGHGRALVDSHESLPVVSASVETLEDDLFPFKVHADMPFAMTAHIVFTAYDDQNPVTLSPIMVKKVIRDHIRFDGLLMTDDLSMKALSGSYAERARKAIEAGNDLLLHCNGDMEEMKEVMSEAPLMSSHLLAVYEQKKYARKPYKSMPVEKYQERLDELMKQDNK